MRGRVLKAPDGDETRPTSDRARQAIFNILEHAPWSNGLGGLAVLDLFAGSGAMGLEALSRGAAGCLFIDSSEAACRAIRSNVEALGLTENASVSRQNVAKLGRRPPAQPPFQLVFLDPPYGSDLGEQALAGLPAGEWLAKDATLVFERKSGSPPVQPEGFEVLDVRTYGVAEMVILRQGR